MPAERHEIVHLVIRLSDTGEYARHALRLFFLRDGLKSEMCRS